MSLTRVLRLPSRASARAAGPSGCRCGHAEQAHEHYRRGTDCALCTCVKFKAGAPAAARATRETRGERAHAA